MATGIITWGWCMDYLVLTIMENFWNVKVKFWLWKTVKYNLICCWKVLPLIMSLEFHVKLDKLSCFIIFQD